MRITRRRAVAATAAATLGLTLTACSSDSGDDDGGPVDMADKMVGAMEDYGVGTSFKATAPIELGLMYRDHPNYPLQDDWSILEHFEEDRNVTFDIQSVPLSDWQQKRSLLISSGDAADLIPSTYAADVETLTSGGAVLPVSDYLDYLPNFMDKVEKWGLQEDLDRLRQADGKFYVLPGLHENPKPSYSVAIRGDWWEDAGLEDPKTWDEFADQLEVIKEEHPEIDYPYTERWSINGPMEATLQAAAGGFGTEAGWGFGDGVTWNGSEYEYTGASAGYKDLITYFADLVERGLLDPEGITQDDDSAKAKFTTGKAAALGSNDQEAVVYRTGFEEAGDKDAEVKHIVVPAGPAGNLMDATTGGQFESGIALSSSAAERDDFVALLQFVDWLYYSDEGLEFAKWGVEGETYTTESDGTRTLADDVDWGGLNPDGTKQLNTDFGYYNGVWSLAHGSTEDLVKSTLAPEVQDFLDEMNQKEVAENGPGIAMDEMQREEASLLQTNLQDLVMTASSQFILGDRPIEEWDAYVAELEAAGMPTYVDTVNQAAGVTE
ncbi:carbohydrate ABC transporter substrate-binding protein, CUT1 family [Promicromonospora umidemergens]|uniref:Extracellular solute-binding protein n=1 Tax=Promicromonospora umidemergens TaxID=629679 RepID=A0ABP8X3R8_9MICO|nr:extracellular solute-binding protein [Promicromonospora umidemergens]MCP2285087.1 carbohydrate ABC transporter substrate-binding protein, CUT1 family [Promicromonospora umidemergens]